MLRINRLKRKTYLRRCIAPCIGGPEVVNYATYRRFYSHKSLSLCKYLFWWRSGDTCICLITSGCTLVHNQGYATRHLLFDATLLINYIVKERILNAISFDDPHLRSMFYRDSPYKPAVQQFRLNLGASPLEVTTEYSIVNE